MRKSLTLLSALAFAGSLFAGEPAAPSEEKKEFTPSGKVSAQIFANYHQTYQDGDHTENALVLGRAYFGYGYSMTENWSAKVKLDVAGDDLGHRTMFLKEASLTYKSGSLTVKGGLIGLVQHKLQEKYWGHRYVYKSFQDAQKMSASADIGILAFYKVNDMTSLDFTVRNGEGYKKEQQDMAYKQQLGLTIKPIDIIEVRGFGSFGADTVLREFSDMDKAELVYGGFLGVKPIDGLMAGVEYTIQDNAKNKTDNKTSGYSVYATYKISPKIEVFGRYDGAAWSEKVVDEDENGDAILDENGNPVHIDYDGSSNSLAIVGLQYSPYKKIKFAFDYQMKSKKKDDAASHGFFIHTDIKF